MNVSEIKWAKKRAKKRIEKQVQKQVQKQAKKSLDILTDKEPVELNEDNLPPGFKPSYKGILSRMIESGVDESIIPFVLGLDKQYSLTKLEKKSCVISKICDEAREKLLDQIEDVTARLALGGTLVERRWSQDEERWVPYKEVQVQPSLEAAKYILSQLRPDTWSPVKEKDRIKVLQQSNVFNIGDKRQNYDDEVTRINRFAGKLFESCTDGDGGESGVPQEIECVSLREQGRSAESIVDVRPESSVCVQGSVLDV